MFYPTVLILFLATSPMLVSSLECYSCKEPFILNYTVTSDTVPSFSECRVFNSSTCYIRVTWDQNTNRTMITIDLASSLPAGYDYDTPDFLVAAVSMGVINHQDHTSFERSLLFFCTTIDRGNNETTLKQILRSLDIEDQFVQEIYPLLKIVDPFDPKSAECIEFHNDTYNCPSKDLNRCQRCYSSANKYLSDSTRICQTCPRTQDFENSAMHASSFELKTRQKTEDNIILQCQMNKCNSIDNINKVSKASKITFNFDKFFKN